jgi:Zn-dependent protease
VGSAPSRQPTDPWSFPLTRVSGIEIRLHIGFVAILVLFALAGSLTWVVLAFTCVVIHELAHSVVARNRGAEVDSILLLPIGGVSKIRHLASDARAEALVAAVGPLASLGLAAASALLAVLLRQALLPVDLYHGPLAHRLAWFNLLLAGFNLLPAFPMDGGRLLRALLTLRYGDERATRVAARLGRGLAAVMFVGGMYWNFWLVLIAVFVYLGATREEVASAVHARARGHRVAEVMLLDPVTVESRATAGAVLPILRHSAQQSFPVVDGGVYAGIVDAVRLRTSPPETLVWSLTDRAAPVLDPDDLVDPTALDALDDSHRRCLAVARAGRVVGMLSEEDVLELLTRPAPLP